MEKGFILRSGLLLHAVDLPVHGSFQSGKPVFLPGGLGLIIGGKATGGSVQRG